MKNTLLSALAALTLAGLPLAHASEPDRSALSYEDNVTINTACFDATKQGQDAFDRCVEAQLAALKAHPAPNRTMLDTRRAGAIQEDCVGLRRDGVAPYNDCLTREVVAATKAPDVTADKDTLPSSVRLARALTDGDAPPRATPVTALSPPRKVLPRRPERVLHTVLTTEVLYRKIERSVFVVGAARSPGDARARDIMQGSAIAVAPHLLLTNCHVVRNRPMIVLLQGHAIYHAKLVAADNAADRCVLQSSGPALTPVAGVRSFADVAVGEPVFAIGAPRALERTFTEGLVSGLRPEPSRNLIQTSAPISPGSSGGGLFDERGNLLGITTLGSLPGSQNLNFAIAASDFWE
ncbi:MAG TPA: serine protease [Stellaceae bacterium]|nr:serine protease [Stellaceae bacterium]